MRKFLAVAMIVLMLVVAVLPVFAEDFNYTSRFDGTTPVHSGPVWMDLVVTEIVNNSTNSYTWVGGTNTSHLDAFTYIEVYNRGTEPVNLYDLALVSYANTRTIKDGAVTHEFFKNTRKFENLVPINDGSIFPAGVSAPCVAVNDSTKGTIAPGQIGIIWIWTNDTVEVAKNSAATNGLGATKDGVTYYHFRTHYHMDTSSAFVSDTTPIVALYGGTANGSVRFTLNKSGQYVYGIVNDDALDASKRFQLADPIFTKDGDNPEVYNANIRCIWQWGLNSATGIASSDTDGNITKPDGTVVEFKPSTMEGLSTIFAPANCKPDLYNAQRKQFDDTAVDKVDYVEIGSDYVFGYREMALIAYKETPTPGEMPAAQWAYLDPDHAPAEVATGEGWQTAAISAFVAARPAVIEEGDAADNKTETKIDVLFKDRSELGNQGKNAKPQTIEENKGLPKWALILIIVGGVVIVGGIAAAVVIIVMKKHKPVAADDVATEGEVEIIDETQEGEAAEAEAAETEAEEKPEDETTEQ